MKRTRRIISGLLVASVVMTVVATPIAAAAPDYRGIVDITFPTVKSARYSNDFANPRGGGRVHRATDLFAPAGSKVVAARGGTVIWLPSSESGLAGFAIQILGDDGRTYAYYHLGRAGGKYRDAVSSKLSLGSRVSRGQFLGWLGDSGNAAGTPHLHFEIHDNKVQDPYGSNRVNPYASLRAAQGLPVGDAGPAAGASGKPVLRIGSSGPAVVTWQKRLNRSGRAPKISTDGAFGPGTQAATVAFQKSAGLGPAGLGVVGPKTRGAMRRVLQNKKGNTTPAPTPPKPKQPTQPTQPKPPATSTSSAPLLRLGSTGEPVAYWQRRLNRSHRAGRVVADGSFGPATHAATVKFQESVGLGPAGLGVVGPNTRAAMRRVLRSMR